MTFKDHFSGHAASYAAYRPGYPPALFVFLETLTPGRELAWDCATGNGQAALSLAEVFARVVATDASRQQLDNAFPHPRVEYRVATAESSGLADASVDLLAVAQAVHWFDFDRFYAEARRVLRPGGAIAVWTYNLLRGTPAISALVDRLAREISGAYWPPERRWVDEEYRTLSFPFPEVPAPVFEHAESWDLERFVAYLRTWSANVRYQAATGKDPIAEIAPDLKAAWGDPEGTRTLTWPIYMRAGRL
ncbi:MAG TPA: class I SAM-dependent methyltransferase [Thermoanaerobaculia bacterium]|jgi:ubiquinone/menaquinone biosynthesis C-methylase UbiE|nr:class I SAM-dependent methyltransferase [Thermoanaerobaculia bacterium]